MLGCIIGDMSGTKYEYQEFLDTRKGIINIDRRKSILDDKTPLLTSSSFISDDSMLTIAIAEAILNKKTYSETLKKYGQLYGNTMNTKEGFFKSPFSPSFIKWCNSYIPEIGTSKGNGSAMRVSPVAYLFDSLEKVQLEAKRSAIPTHNSIEAIKGAESLATTIFLARQKLPKDEIKKYITSHYGYNLELNLENLQNTNIFDGTCETTVPQAIFIFLNSNSFEDSIRKAISIGGDTDTIACMTGSISEAYYSIPKILRQQALDLLPQEFKKILLKAYLSIGKDSSLLKEERIK